ncbi:MAG: carbohydrate-binding protein, partial [Nitriliruptoraceae bacterium]
QEADPKWELYVPGFEFENDWQLGTVYQKGDVVRYGGYLYTALRQNDGNVPSVEFGDSSIANWELLKTGYRVVEGGEWDVISGFNFNEYKIKAARHRPCPQRP